MMKAILVLEDGTVFEGKGFGAPGETLGEVVFNTSMSGYQEILTDPSYHEQIITMTYPLIGNYGINPKDVESVKIRSAGFIVKEACPFPSSWRSKNSLENYFRRNGIIGIEGIDTRMLVRHIREKGAMNGILSTRDFNIKNLRNKLSRYPSMAGRDLAIEVSCKKPYAWRLPVRDVISGKKIKPRPKYKVVAYDYGIKHNILRLLVSHGCEVIVVPAQLPAKDVLAKKPDGVFLSNGPGDPEPMTYAVDNVRQLLGRVPVFGICQGNHILTLALGGKTYKLKFGHRGANHPVKNLVTGKIEITSQNHGFCANIDSFKGKGVELTHLNLNDNTCEGIRSKKYPAYSVQYHPEASPGPHDSLYLFDDFLELMENA